MARARNIKPGFFVNADLVELEPLVRLLFIGLWTIADRRGRLEDRPKQIKIQVLPADDLDIENALNQLYSAKFIFRYSVGESKFIQILNFEKHQSPHMKEPESTIPAPDSPGAKPMSAALIADCPLLIADTGLPFADTPSLNAGCVSNETLSGKPDGELKKDPIPYVAIIKHFNDTCGTRYRDIETNRALIRVLWKHGFREPDFQKVIETMQAKWGRDPQMKQYLRPATLFQPKKFEGYLNAEVTLSDRGVVDRKMERGLEVIRNFKAPKGGLF